MKTKETNRKKVIKGFQIKNSLKEKYNAQPLFKDKIEQANHILKTIALPKA